MTEQEWLASEDPEAMLSWAKSPNVDPTNKAAQCEANRRLSDRKLRLWVEACRKRWPQWKGEGDLGDVATLRTAVRFWSSGWAGTGTGHARHICDLLRDIVGNPWRPVTLPEGPKCQVCRGDGAGWTGDNISTPVDWWECDVCGGAGRLPCPWLTPTVLSLAHAAYDERAWRECAKCRNNPGMAVGMFASTNHPGFGDPCGYCQGTGRINDGTLDPVRLAILADALEEASCNNREILDHLRNNAVHVRGCWVLDLVLGKE